MASIAKTVIITGASSGIGEALAYEAASLGFNLCIAARQEDKLEQVRQKCESFGIRCIAVRADVSREQDCIDLVEVCAKTFGGIDILVNNAGIGMRALLKDCELDVIKCVMDVNFWGTVYCTKYALSYLLASKGSVVGVSSIAGIKGLPARTGYSASKFAVHGFLESLRIENMKTGLHVLLACPGYTASNIRNVALNEKGASQAESPYDESKLMQPGAVARHVFKAIAKRRKYLYLTFQGKMVLLLSKFLPGLLDKMVYNTVAKEKNSPFK